MTYDEFPNLATTDPAKRWTFILRVCRKQIEMVCEKTVWLFYSDSFREQLRINFIQLLTFFKQKKALVGYGVTVVSVNKDRIDIVLSCDLKTAWKTTHRFILFKDGQIIG